MKKKTKGRMRARAAGHRGDQCIGCFSIAYLHARGAERLDFQSEVDGLVAVLEHEGYTGLRTVSREQLDAFLGEEFDARARAAGGVPRWAAIARTAIERSWEAAHAAPTS
jgi:hypothetical protein